MIERNSNFKFDFMPLGQAIKKARESKGMTREQLAEIIGYAPRHIQAIENEGQHPRAYQRFPRQSYQEPLQNRYRTRGSNQALIC